MKRILHNKTNFRIFYSLFKSTKAQLGDTLTWVVATIIIIILLLVSVFVASLSTNDKFFSSANQVNLAAGQSLVSYLLTNDSSGTPIYQIINEKGNFDDFSGNLASSIFKTLYGGYYNGKQVLAVFNLNQKLGPVTSYFGGGNLLIPGVSPFPQVNYVIFLNNSKVIHLVLQTNQYQIQEA